MKAKTVIVGGGIMGTSIAMNAARTSDPLSEPVVLLERSSLGAGSSGRSGAVLRQHYADREVAALARDSLRAYTSFATRTGRRIGFERTGVLLLARPGGTPSPEALAANVEMQRAIGIGTSLLEAAELRELVPGIEIADDVVGAWEPDSGIVDPERTVDQFAALARTYGAVTRIGIEAREVLVENGRVTGVQTADGVIQADNVVLAAGPWTVRLLATLGIDIPLRVVRPEQHWVALPTREGAEELEDLAQTRIRGADLIDPLERMSEEMAREGGTRESHHPVLIDLEHQLYARCEPRTSRTRVGRTNYTDLQVIEDPDQLDETVDVANGKPLRDTLAVRLPIYEGMPDMGAQAAWYTLTPDAQPVIGPIDDFEGLFVAAGFSGHGFKLAPSVGEGLAQKVAGDPVSAYDEAFFSPARFAGGFDGWTGAFGF